MDIELLSAGSLLRRIRDSLSDEGGAVDGFSTRWGGGGTELRAVCNMYSGCRMNNLRGGRRGAKQELKSYVC